MILNSNILGKYNEKHVLILHGLYGSSDSWLNIGKSLSAGYCVHLLDIRNHGKSFHHHVHDYNSMVEDVKTYAIDCHNLQKFSIIGHSMGGKIAMFFAEKYSSYLDKMIIADMSPRAYTSLQNIDSNVTFHLNLIFMMKTLDLSKASNYSDVEKQLPVADKNIRDIVLKNLKKENGKFIWKINLDAITNNINNIFDGIDVEKHVDGKVEIETLFLKGANSDYICDIDKKMINYIFLNASVVEIPGAGHWLHVDQPEVVKAVIKNFLEKR